MNDLSWLIYLAEVSDRLIAVCGFISVIIGVFGGFGTIILWYLFFCGEWKTKVVAPIMITAMWFFIVFPSVIGSCFIPSSKTIYMIAASEVGEQIVSSPETKEVLDSIRRTITQKLKSLEE